MLDNIEGEVILETSVAPFTSWKVGGECKAITFPENIEDILNVIKYCNSNKLPYVVIGKGSNILKSDQYFNGVIINISRTFNEISLKENKIVVGAGCMLPKLAFKLARNGIANFDFYAGIPGTVGGAIVMNAGSDGKETKDILISVTYIDENGKIVKDNTNDVEFGFRKSKFQEKNTIIISAEFKKESLEKEIALEKTKKIADRRKQKFPLNVATAGSTFKSPINGPFPGEIIEKFRIERVRNWRSEN
ncbi:UDP-N-acetylmuramate dehydrogenase [Sinobaca sp. H24]|uniref:UDP-N-acetylmuramate dehydrogenase n=1 Tax=Sinobaca sp. H24 TaxID=2923376 RepID=UPI00207934AA|nr:UDP-N-acetylmuramate dehydrogenase [Sinobaca sp. H24]